MKSRLMMLTIVIGISLPVAAALATPLDSAFTYQGQLKSNGQPVTATVDFKFHLYNSDDGGVTVAHEQTLYDVPVVNGLFTVELDFGTAAFADEQRWLDVEVRHPAGTGLYATLDPRQKITPSPYTLYALDAAVAGPVWEINGDDIYYADGFVGIGTNGPEYPVHVAVEDHDTTLYVRNDTNWASASAIRGERRGGTGSGMYGIGDYIGVTGVCDGNPGYGVLGSVSSASPTASGYGVAGQAWTTNGDGVYGKAWGNGNAYGGVFETVSQGGRGVYALASAADGSTYGVYGQSDSSSGCGVYGIASETSGNVFGVRGSIFSDNGAAVAGYSYGTTGYGNGVFGQSHSSISAGVKGVNYEDGIGIYGIADGDGLAGYFLGRTAVNGFVGVQTITPDVPLDVVGNNNWDVGSTEGDFRIGNASGTYRLKMGVATGGLGAGTCRIYASGGSNRLILGADDEDVITVNDTQFNTPSVTIDHHAGSTSYTRALQINADGTEDPIGLGIQVDSFYGTLGYLDLNTGGGSSAPNFPAFQVNSDNTGATGYFTAENGYNNTGAVIGYNLGTQANSAGVVGICSSGDGVRGTGAYGVYGSGTQRGVYGVVETTDDTTDYGLYGTVTRGSGSNAGYKYAIRGSASGGAYNYGVRSSATDTDATYNYAGYFQGQNADTNYGVYATASGGTNNYAGYFSGNVSVTGTLSKGAGSFKIDHPLDPENKYLYHSFVESPDMMNIYNGNVVLDDSGQAVVTMPEWFEALNREFRYQLTCIGGFAQVYVADEIKDNKFTIAGGEPGLKVSWQVTGVRHDAFAESHRIPVEAEKTEAERGLYLHPQAFGKSIDNGIETLCQTPDDAIEQEPTEPFNDIAPVREFGEPSENEIETQIE